MCVFSNHSERFLFFLLISSSSSTFILPLFPLLCGLGTFPSGASASPVPGVSGTLRNSHRSLISITCLHFFFMKI